VVVVGQADSAQVRLGTLPNTDLSHAVTVGSEPTGLAVNPAGTRAYVTDQFSGSVAVVDLGSGTGVDVIPVPGSPLVVTVAPDGNSIFVSSNVDTVYRIGTNHTVLGAIGGAGAANALVFSPDQQHLYASIPFAGVVQDIAVASSALSRTFTIPGTPQGLAASPDGKTLYVANESSNYLYAVSVASGNVTDSIGVASGGFGLALTPDGAQLYLTRSGAGRVTIVDLTTRDTSSLNVGGAPRRLAFDPTGAYAVVANESGWVTYIH
jgi:YVTN family beta-propeller protein